MPNKKRTPTGKLPTTNLASTNPYGFGTVHYEGPTGKAAEGIEDEEISQFAHILGNPNLTEAQKRRAILRESGHTTSRKKYNTDAERKAGAKAASDARKARRKAELASLGITGPTTRGAPRSYEEKRSTSRERGGSKRDWTRLMTLAVPRTAKAFGMNPEKIKTDVGAGGRDIRDIKQMMLDELKKELE